MATQFDTLINQIYQQQLGREADPEGAAYYAQQLASGRTPEQIAAEINQSLEGQQFDTQALTSIYRTQFERNPEQKGFQYWMSVAQSDPAMFDTALRQAIVTGAQNEDIIKAAAAGSGYTNVELADLEADPYGGRAPTTDIYALPSDATNISYINGRPVQFVAPVTQQPVISQYGAEGFTANTGLDVLSSPVVSAAVARALNSGAMSQAEYDTMVGDLTKAANMQDVYAAFNKPQAQVVLDAVYGLQTGQGNTLAEAQAQAANMQPIIDAINQGYYPSNLTVAQEAVNQGVPYAFGPEAYQGYNTMMTQGDVVTDANFKNKVNQVIKDLYGTYGQENTLQTPLTGSYYSERGLESGYTPLGVAGNPVFRSGVAGYTPTLPTGFQFGIPPVNAVVPQFIPGEFTAKFDANGNLITAPTAPTDTTGA